MTLTHYTQTYIRPKTDTVVPAAQSVPVKEEAEDQFYVIATSGD